MGWFSRKPTHERQVEAAITVASNLYLQSVPEAEEAIAPLLFSLPDSRLRYLLFCLAAMSAACSREMADPNAILNDSFRFLVKWAITERAQEFFGDQVDDPQAVATNAGIYLQQYLDNWSTYIELEKQGGYNEKIISLLCTMIRFAESDLPPNPTDEERLGPLALQLDCRFPTMRDAFSALVRR